MIIKDRLWINMWRPVNVSILWRVLFFLVNFILSFHEVVASGLSCDVKINIVEKTICSNEKLLIADMIMNDFYQTLRKKGRLTNEEAARQHQWLKEVRDPCQANDDCLFSAYSIRSEELGNIATHITDSPLRFKENFQINGLVEGRMRTPNWLEGGRPTASGIYKDVNGNFYSKSYFNIPAYGKTMQDESDFTDLQSHKSFFPSNSLSELQELNPVPQCKDASKLPSVSEDKWVCLVPTYQSVGVKTKASKANIDECPIRSDAFALLKWHGGAWKRYRIVISNLYPKVYINSLCGFLGDEYRVYSKRFHYEPQDAQLYVLNNNEMALVVDNLFIRFDKTSEKFNYPGVTLIAEDQLEGLKLEVWKKVNKRLEKRAQIIAYESLLDKELSRFLEKSSF